MDPNNILALLQGDQPVNVLQGMPTSLPEQNVQLPGLTPPPTLPVSTPPNPAAAKAEQDAPPTPKPRRSVLDTIGRIADVLATVGGAQALYQPTLDAREDRATMRADHARQVDMDLLKEELAKQQVAEGALEPQIAERKRIGVALGALDGQDDAAALWPQIADQAGIDPQKAAAIGAILQKNPGAAGILARSLGADVANLGKNVFFGTDTNGKTVAYQVGPDGHPHILDFGTAGITPSEPIKVVDTGGSQVIVGQSGNPKKILPKTEAPGRALDRQERAREANQTSRTQLTIAGMPARQNVGKGATAGGDLGTANMLLDNIERGFNDLHGMQALPGEGSAIGQIAGAIGRTGIGQKIGEQTGNAAAQKRLEIEKDINSLQSEMVKSLPASATRTKFEQEIQRRRMPDPSRMSYQTAQNVIADLRRMFAQAQKDAAAELAKKSSAPRSPTIRPKTQSGWSIVKVQ